MSFFWDKLKYIFLKKNIWYKGITKGINVDGLYT
jgi:hypothetical protein